MKISAPDNLFLPHDDPSADFDPGFFQALASLPPLDMGIIGNNKKKRLKPGFGDHNDCQSSGDDDASSGKPAAESKKRKKKAITELVASLLMLDEQEKAEEEENDRASQQEKVLYEENHKRNTQTMLKYYSQLQNLYSDVEESDRCRTKRARVSGAAVAAAAAAADESAQGGGAGAAAAAATVHHRRLWVKDRSRAWWEKCNHPDFPEEEFRSAFRMGRAIVRHDLR